MPRSSTRSPILDMETPGARQRPECENFTPPANDATGGSNRCRVGRTAAFAPFAWRGHALLLRRILLASVLVLLGVAQADTLPH